jgi:hypothetical protein
MVAAAKTRQKNVLSQSCCIELRSNASTEDVSLGNALTCVAMKPD